MMVIYRALETNKNTQAFGESQACIKTGNNPNYSRRIIAKPKNGCPKGYTDFYQNMGMKGHNGQDLSCWHGEPIYFPVKANTDWYAKDASDVNGGLGVDVFSEERLYFPELPPHTGMEAREDWAANGNKLFVKFRFWHTLKAKKDKNVEFGEEIARGDNTGTSTGNHLHFSMKFVTEGGKTHDRYNGFMGAVDHTEFFQNEFVLDVLAKNPDLTCEEHMRRIGHRVKNFL